MTDYVFLSTALVAAILTGVAMLAMLATFVVGALGQSGRRFTVVLFVCLAVIWVGAVLVVVLIKPAI